MQVAAIGAGGDVLGAAKSAGHLLCMVCVSNVSVDRSSKLCETKGDGDQRADSACAELSSAISFSSQAFSIILIIRFFSSFLDHPDHSEWMRCKTYERIQASISKHHTCGHTRPRERGCTHSCRARDLCGKALIMVSSFAAFLFAAVHATGDIAFEVRDWRIWSEL